MMETVNVDTARLQLLNDRINQALEAIQGVRQLSSPGFQHSTGVGVPGAFGAGQYPIGQFAGQHPLAALALMQAYSGGIGHTTGMPGVGGIGAIGGQHPFAGFMGQHPIAQFVGQHPLAALALMQAYSGGIGHSGMQNPMNPFGVQNPLASTLPGLRPGRRRSGERRLRGLQPLAVSVP